MPGQKLSEVIESSCRFNRLLDATQQGEIHNGLKGRETLASLFAKAEFQTECNRLQQALAQAFGSSAFESTSFDARHVRHVVLLLIALDLFPKQRLLRHPSHVRRWTGNLSLFFGDVLSTVHVALVLVFSEGRIELA